MVGFILGKEGKTDQRKIRDLVWGFRREIASGKKYVAIFSRLCRHHILASFFFFSLFHSIYPIPILFFFIVLRKLILVFFKG